MCLKKLGFPFPELDKALLFSTYFCVGKRGGGERESKRERNRERESERVREREIREREKT